MQISDAVDRHSSTTKIECWPQLFELILFCSISTNPPTRYLMSTILSATSKEGVGTRIWWIPEQELKIASLGGTKCQGSSCSTVGVAETFAWRNPVRSSEQESAEPDAFWQDEMMMRRDSARVFHVAILNQTISHWSVSRNQARKD